MTNARRDGEACVGLVWLKEAASGGPPTTLFGELRLLGLFVVALGSTQLARRALVLIADERGAQQEELRGRPAPAAGRRADRRARP
jgi:hypothetical protein